jgi:hypothetical protein
MDKTSFQKGMIGDADFIKFAAKKNWNIYKGFNGHEPVDYIVDDGNKLLKVEVKRIQSTQITARNHYYCTVTKFDAKNFDYMFISTPQGCYFIPADDCPKDTLSIKMFMPEDHYDRKITKPGKYEVHRVFCE